MPMPGSIFVLFLYNTVESLVTLSLARIIAKDNPPKKVFYGTAAAYAFLSWVLQMYVEPSMPRLFVNMLMLFIALVSVLGLNPWRAVISIFATVFGEALGEGLAYLITTMLRIPAERVLDDPLIRIPAALLMLVPLILTVLVAGRRSGVGGTDPIRNNQTGYSRLMTYLALGMSVILGTTVLIWKSYTLTIHNPLNFSIAPSPFDSLYVIIASSSVILGLIAAKLSEDESSRKLAMEKRLSDELRESFHRLETAQAELVEAEKFKALAEMAGGMAHSFNNTLATMRARVQLLSTRSDLDEYSRNMINRLLENVDEASAHVARVRWISSAAGKESFEPLDLASLLRNLQGNGQGGSVPISMDLPEICVVMGNGLQLKDAIANIINNALDAVRTKISLGSPGSVGVLLTNTVEGSCRIVVKDDGDGIPEEVLSKVFLPFYSTKSGNGMGLGLSISREIVHRHGGDIGIVSHPEQGTTVTITLPLAEPGTGIKPKGDAVGAAFSSFAPDLSGLKVLLLDDNKDTIEAISEYLSRFGCECMMASESKDIKALMGNPPDSDLVVTDLTMPGINGLEVAGTMSAIGIPVILITGWAGQLDDDAIKLHGVSMVIPKPFDLEDITANICRLTGVGAYAPKRNT